MKIFNFLKTKNDSSTNKLNGDTKKSDSKSETSNVSVVTDGLKSYVEFNQEFAEFNNEEYSLEYINAIRSIVDYLQHLYHNKTQDDIVPEININDMSQGISDFIISLLPPQSINKLIYIINDKNSAHFHVNNNQVEIAENLCTLPSLNFKVRTINLDNIFTGLTIFQAYALLNQMNVLPPKNNLDKEIETYYKRVKLHILIIKDIVASLLLSPSKENYKIAQIFISYFDPDFNLPPYKTTIEENPKKLTYHTSSQN